MPAATAAAAAAALLWLWRTAMLSRRCAAEEMLCRRRADSRCAAPTVKEPRRDGAACAL